MEEPSTWNDLAELPADPPEMRHVCGDRGYVQKERVYYKK